MFQTPECVTAFAKADFIFGLYSLGYHLEANAALLLRGGDYWGGPGLLWGGPGPGSALPSHSFTQRYRCVGNSDE